MEDISIIPTLKQRLSELNPPQEFTPEVMKRVQNYVLLRMEYWYDHNVTGELQIPVDEIIKAIK